MRMIMMKEQEEMEVKLLAPSGKSVLRKVGAEK
jgi:hypothetical protein